MPNVKVVVFGRGNGESILVEIEKDHWMVVDSFVNPQTRKPAAISYLESKGLDPKEVLRTVVMTHFHEDHIKGMSNVIANAHPDAKVCMPQALTEKEAITFYNSFDMLNGYDDASMVREMVKVLDYLEKHKKHPVKLTQDKLIFENTSHVITALSPSDFDCHEATNRFVAEISGVKDIPKAASKHSPNHFCIAINIENKHNKESVLLGGDLEICSNPQGGWDGVLNTIKAPELGSIEIFKVPHHGSETAFHQDTWEQYTAEDVVALLTTYNSSSLPREEYVKIFKGFTNHLICTTKPKYPTKGVLSQKALSILSKKKSSIVMSNVTPKSSFGYVESTHNSHYVSYSLFEDATLL
ncbi:TPA: MBL fold metallo-hydrolase [Vibrio parahaemolyticus]|nr:MBL fold metallo-hydrolase [Vibrio parahaemolyticus]